MISKLTLSVRAGLCGYSPLPRRRKNLSTPLMMINVLCVVKKIMRTVTVVVAPSSSLYDIDGELDGRDM